MKETNNFMYTAPTSYIIENPKQPMYQKEEHSLLKHKLWKK